MTFICLYGSLNGETKISGDPIGWNFVIVRNLYSSIFSVDNKRQGGAGRARAGATCVSLHPVHSSSTVGQQWRPGVKNNRQIKINHTKTFFKDVTQHLENQVFFKLEIFDLF